MACKSRPDDQAVNEKSDDDGLERQVTFAKHARQRPPEAKSLKDEPCATRQQEADGEDHDELAEHRA